jgi:Uma2 family endonuclease
VDAKKEACLDLCDPNPILVIEIVSPGNESSNNYKRDYEQKPKEYAAHRTNTISSGVFAKHSMVYDRPEVIAIDLRSRLLKR